MKSLDCDQVFDVLTRGPFPTGDAVDAPVERHLAACYECRQLAEALRPAVDLFHEAIEPEQGRDLPGYHGAMSSSSGGLAQLVAQAIENDSYDESVARPVTKPSLWQRLQAYRPNQWESFLAATAAGALFMLAVAGWSIEADQPPSAAIAMAPSEDGLVHLASLDLKRSCFQWSPGVASSTLQCCTQCHAAGTEKRHVERVIAVVASSCASCHR